MSSVAMNLSYPQKLAILAIQPESSLTLENFPNIFDSDTS